MQNNGDTLEKRPNFSQVSGFSQAEKEARRTLYRVPRLFVHLSPLFSLFFYSKALRGPEAWVESWVTGYTFCQL